MKAKMEDRSVMDYFIVKSAKAFEMCYNYFIGKKDMPESVFIPDDFLSDGAKFMFVLTSIDDYFYSKSDAKLKTRICCKADDNQTAEEILNSQSSCQ